MIFAALLTLLVQDTSGVESLIRDLDAEALEVRQRAHRALVAKGPSVAPALRRASTTGDEEYRIRINTILDVVERGERERLHDLDQKESLLLLHRKGKAEKDLGEGDAEGARFQVSAYPFDGGWIIRTAVEDFLRRRADSGPGRSQLQFDVQSVSDLPIERCGKCSPRLVYVKAPPGLLKVRLTGEHVWFSPYVVEFKNPDVGQRKLIGDFTLEVTGIQLTLKCPKGFPSDWIRSMEATCMAEFDPKLKKKDPGWST